MEINTLSSSSAEILSDREENNYLSNELDLFYTL